MGPGLACPGALEGVLKLKHKSLNFNVSPPADTEEIAQMPLVGYIDFEVWQGQRVRALRLLADKATCPQRTSGVCGGFDGRAGQAGAQGGA